MRRRPSIVFSLVVLLAAPAAPAPLTPLDALQDPEEDGVEETTAPAAAPEEQEGEGGRSKEERQQRRKQRKERKGAAEAATAAEGSVEGDGEATDEVGEAAEGEGGEEREDDSDSSSSSDSEPDSDSGTDLDSDSGADSESDSDSDASSDSDTDSDHPALVVITTDAACHVFVDGTSEGVIEPGETREVGVDLGEIEIRATAVSVTRATWEKTLEFEEEGEVGTIRVRMKKTIRKTREEERRTGVFRDRKTSLMWMKRDNGRDVDLRRAFGFCRDLDVGGYDSWRLPSLEELRSLEAIWMRASYKIHGDILLTECCMWSTDYDGQERAWTFNFRFRKAFETNAGYQLGLRALCVREWDPELEGGGDDEKDGDASEELEAGEDATLDGVEEPDEAGENDDGG